MKIYTILFTILLCLLFQTTYAQEESSGKGYVIGGSFNYQTQNNGYSFISPNIYSGISGIGGLFSNSIQDSKNTIFSFAPYVGKNINNHLLIGLGLDYRIGTYKAKIKSNTVFPDPQIYIAQIDKKANQVGADFFVRYTFVPQNKLSFYLQPYLTYKILKEETKVNRGKPDNMKREISYFGTGIDIGISYDISNRFAILLHSGGLQYINGTYEEIDTDNNKDFSSFGISFKLSNIYFGMEMKF